MLVCVAGGGVVTGGRSRDRVGCRAVRAALGAGLLRAVLRGNVLVWPAPVVFLCHAYAATRIDGASTPMPRAHRTARRLRRIKARSPNGAVSG